MSGVENNAWHRVGSVQVLAMWGTNTDMIRIQITSLKKK